MPTIKTFLSVWVLGPVLLAAASVPAQAEVINACIQKNQGALRLVASPEECNPNSELAVSWTDAAGLQEQIDTLTDQVAALETANAALAARSNNLATVSGNGSIIRGGRNKKYRQ